MLGPSGDPSANRAVCPNPLVLVGMPCWDCSKPFHALTLVAGITRESGVDVRPHDVNVAFYREIAEEERKYWNEDHNHLWFSTDLPAELWSRYEGWLHAYLDQMLEGLAPLLVAFSVNISTRAFSIMAARYVKSRRPELPILFGGVDCFPKEHGKRFLEATADRYCDIICQGEAEISLPRFLRELAATGNWKTNVPGFAYYDGDRLVDTGDTELPTLKEKLPVPAYDLFDLEQYTEPGSIPFFLTRGCIYSCHFCSEKPNFKRFRSRAAEEAVEELRAVLPHVRRHSRRPTISLSDSNLNADMRMLRRFVDLVLEHKLKITWGGQAHISPHMTTEFIEKLARSGFCSVFWGIETGSQHVVDLMNKRYHQTDARRILRDCSRAGIAQHIPIILGFPGETPEDVAETIEFIFEYKDLPGCHVHLPCQIVVRPNSPLHSRYEEFGLSNNSYYEWCTVDGTNTLPIRIARRFVARQAHGNASLSMEGLVDTGEMPVIRLNQPNTAEDLYRLIREVYRRAGDVAPFEEGIATWAKAVGCALGADSRETWLALDKDSAEGRKQIYTMVLDGLARLKQAVAARLEAARGPVQFHTRIFAAFERVKRALSRKRGAKAA